MRHRPANGPPGTQRAGRFRPPHPPARRDPRRRRGRPGRGPVRHRRQCRRPDPPARPAGGDLPHPAGAGPGTGPGAPPPHRHGQSSVEKSRDPRRTLQCGPPLAGTAPLRGGGIGTPHGVRPLLDLDGRGCGYPDGGLGLLAVGPSPLFCSSFRPCGPGEPLGRLHRRPSVSQSDSRTGQRILQRRHHRGIDRQPRPPGGVEGVRPHLRFRLQGKRGGHSRRRAPAGGEPGPGGKRPPGGGPVQGDGPTHPDQ